MAKTKKTKIKHTSWSALMKQAEQKFKIWDCEFLAKPLTYGEYRTLIGFGWADDEDKTIWYKLFDAILKERTLTPDKLKSNYADLLEKYEYQQVVEYLADPTTYGADGKFGLDLQPQIVDDEMTTIELEDVESRTFWRRYYKAREWVEYLNWLMMDDGQYAKEKAEILLGFLNSRQTKESKDEHGEVTGEWLDKIPQPLIPDLAKLFLGKDFVEVEEKKVGKEDAKLKNS